MSRILIINDSHFGVKRQGGTTPDSRKALDIYMMKEFVEILSIPHDEIIILGDLCDSRNIQEHIMKEVIEILKY